MSTREVAALITKAATADKPEDAMKFAQAALNAANATAQAFYVSKQMSEPATEPTE